MRTSNQPLDTHIHTKSLKCIHLLFTFFGLAVYRHFQQVFNYIRHMTTNLVGEGSWYNSLNTGPVVHLYVSGNLSTLMVSVRVLVYIFVRNACPLTDNNIYTCMYMYLSHSNQYLLFLFIL